MKGKLIWWAFGVLLTVCPSGRADDGTTITISVDRGRDLGQSFGSLFEATSDDGSLTIGAGFANQYNTRYRGDRHELQLFLRPQAGGQEIVAETLPRPNAICGTYLHGRDGTIRSTYGGLQAWNAKDGAWQPAPAHGGTEETMRVGNGVLQFGDSTVRYNDKLVLDRPAKGSYQLFFYANGHLCFYHVNRGAGGYREYQSDEDGFSKLYACPWTTDQERVDLSRASVMRLPVVGETTFAWGQLGKQVVTGSNIGGFYVFQDSQWRMLLAPQLGVSYQLYSTLAFHDRLLMGQYPTGRLFSYDGRQISDQPGWPPVLEGVSSQAREAQTTTIYGGAVFVGVWPWAELWRYNPGGKQWSFARRMFSHPQLSDKITHPYDKENQGNPVGNLWGQRITSLAPSGASLFVSTSAKHPCDWDAQAFPFLAPEKWKSYGTVYRLSMPGHLGAPTAWTEGPTSFQITVGKDGMTIAQDGKLLARAALPEPLARQAEAATFSQATWGDGIYGQFTGKVVAKAHR